MVLPIPRCARCRHELPTDTRHYCAACLPAVVEELEARVATLGAYQAGTDAAISQLTRVLGDLQREVIDLQTSIRLALEVVERLKAAAVRQEVSP